MEVFRPPPATGTRRRYITFSPQKFVLLTEGYLSLALNLRAFSPAVRAVGKFNQVPFLISKFFTSGFGVSIPTRQLFWSLICTLLFPLVLGKLARNIFKGLATYTDQNGRILSMASTILLSLLPWMQVSISRSFLLVVRDQVIMKAVGLGILVHLCLLGLNAVAVQSFSAAFGSRESYFGKKENARALLICCSQKALLTVVTVVEQLNGVLGESGLLTLPCVAAHINQIIIDSFLVNFWLQKDQSLNNMKNL